MNELDMAEVLSFPLTEVPFSLCHITGAMNKTDILDATFFLRTTPELPPTFAGIAQPILQKACEFSEAVHIVCDTYSDGPSIKGHERQERGDYQAKFQIIGPSQRRPANFYTALLSASFKTALLQFL